MPGTTPGLFPLSDYALIDTHSQVLGLPPIHFLVPSGLATAGSATEANRIGIVFSATGSSFTLENSPGSVSSYVSVGGVRHIGWAEGVITMEDADRTRMDRSRGFARAARIGRNGST